MSMLPGVLVSVRDIPEEVYPMREQDVQHRSHRGAEAMVIEARARYSRNCAYQDDALKRATISVVRCQRGKERTSCQFIRDIWSTMLDSAKKRLVLRAWSR